MRWAGHVPDKISVHRMLCGKPDANKLHGWPRHRREDTIQIYLKEIGWKDVDWVCLVQDRTSG